MFGHLFHWMKYLQNSFLLEEPTLRRPSSANIPPAYEEIWLAECGWLFPSSCLGQGRYQVGGRERLCHFFTCFDCLMDGCTGLMDLQAGMR